MNATDTYIWVRSQARDYVLRRGDGAKAGSVRFEGFCGTAARAVSGGGTWTFQRSGLFKPVVTVRRTGERADLFVAPIGFAGTCEIALDDGSCYRWKATSCLRGEYAWLDADGAALIRYRPRSWFRGEQRIDVTSDALPPERAMLLALLGGFLLTLTNNDATAAAVAIIVSAVAVS